MDFRTGADFSKIKTLIFGFQTSSPANVRVIIEDGSGKKAAYLLHDVTTNPLYYRLTLPTEDQRLDRKNIKRIQFLLEGGSSSGILNLEANGF